MIDRVKQLNQSSPFKSVADAMAQLQALAKPVVSYLYSVETWNYFELYWFRHLMVALPTATIQNLLPLAIKRSEKYRAFNQIRNIRIRTLFAAFSVFINDRQLTDAKKALDTAKTLLHDSDDLTNAAMLLFLRGWYHVIADQPEIGWELCHQAISLAHILDQPKQEQQLRYSLEFIHQNVNNPEKVAFFL